MDVDQIIATLGIAAHDQVVVSESVENLWSVIEYSPEFMALLQDDGFASRLNAYLQGHTVRRIEKLEFIDASYGHIGEMIAALRGKGESYAYFHNGGMPGLKHRGPTVDLDAALRSVGWRALSDEEMRVLYLAPNIVRC
jgi:hypothetical protein